MKFRTWLRWVGSKPWSLKWFIFLILLRPVIDNFYFLKEVSPVLSPLYWAGILTPILCISPILSYKYFHNRIHRLFNLWSVLIILNTILIIYQPGDLISITQWILKLSLPVYLFFFIRIFIHNRTDFIGLLNTFMYASGIAALMLLFELLVNPIRIEYSRGIERIQGGYADVMNYAIYLTFGFLVLSYFYIISKLKKTNFRINLWFLMLVSAICISGLIGISHTASYAVFAALIVLFIASLARRFGFIALFMVIIIWILIYSYGGKFYEQYLNPLAEREIEVIVGTRDESQLFHGRMARWQYAWENFQDSPATAWLFGYPTSFENSLFNISIGIHNDYLRIFYFTGIVGFCIFYLFIYYLWRRIRFLKMPEKYLLNGSLAILLLYSVSTTPTFYANFLYILFTIFVYFSLPTRKLLENA